MILHPRWLALLLLGCIGCASLRGGPSGTHDTLHGNGVLHRLGEPPANLRTACQCVPAEARDRVHLFALNGMDPLYLGNLHGLCAAMQQLGFRNVHCAQRWQAAAVRDEIVVLRRAHPDARIAVVGFSVGANYACRLAHELNERGIAIDLLVYVGGDTLENVPASRPVNVGQVVNITGHGYLPRGGDLFYNGVNIDGAQNHRLDARHMLLPTRPETVELLATHLLDVARGPAAGLGEHTTERTATAIQGPHARRH